MNEELESQTFSGRTVRVVSPTKTSVDEVFVMLLDSTVPADEFLFDRRREVNIVADVVEFWDQPKSRAAVVYANRIVNRMPRDEFTEWFFAGNRVSASEAEPVTIDATDVEPMADNEFWTLVSLAGNNPENDWAPLMASLSALPLEGILGFAKVFSEVVLEARLRVLERVEASLGLAACDSGSPFAKACEVICRGEAEYQGLVREDHPFTEQVDPEFARLIQVPSRAYAAKLGIPARVVSRAELPADRAARARAYRPVTGWNPDARQQQLDRRAAVRGIADAKSDAWFNARIGGTWFGGRALIAVEGGYSEVVLFFPAQPGTDPTLALAQASRETAE